MKTSFVIEVVTQLINNKGINPDEAIALVKYNISEGFVNMRPNPKNPDNFQEAILYPADMSDFMKQYGITKKDLFCVEGLLAECAEDEDCGEDDCEECGF
jgi:hypothetical protein